MPNKKPRSVGSMLSINGAADLLERDRGTLTRALRDVPPDGKDAQGRPRWKLATIAKALAIGSSLGVSAAADAIERASADVENALRQLRAAPNVEASRRLLRDGLGRRIGVLDEALAASLAGMLPAERNLLQLVCDQIVGSAIGEMLALCFAQERG